MADDKKRDDFTIDMNERNGKSYDSPSSPRHVPQAAAPLAAVANNPVLPILSYCASSILMTVTNKFVLSGFGFNLNFFLLCVQVCSPSAERLGDMVLMQRQSVVCVIAIQTCKSMGVITYRDFNTDEARKCEPLLTSSLDL
jgi:GDP-mannose transporter